MKPPPKLLTAVIEEIERIASMKPDEIMKQTDVGFFELLDMSLTLIEEIKSTKG